jgi:hypothetical protein
LTASSTTLAAGSKSDFLVDNLSNQQAGRPTIGRPEPDRSPSTGGPAATNASGHSPAGAGGGQRDRTERPDIPTLTVVRDRGLSTGDFLKKL